MWMESMLTAINHLSIVLTLEPKRCSNICNVIHTLKVNTNKYYCYINNI